MWQQFQSKYETETFDSDRICAILSYTSCYQKGTGAIYIVVLSLFYYFHFLLCSVN